MTSRDRRRVALAAFTRLTVLLAVVLTGCEFKYRATTVLHADGSVDREVFQPAGEGNDEGPRAAGWAKPPVYSEDKSTGVTRKYFAASGHFASADKVPDHFVARWPDQEKYNLPADLPPGHLVRRAARVDYVFVTQHEWVETLTDAVTYDGARRARDELADLGIAIGRDIVDEVLGKQYDFDGLEKWARTEGKAWLAEVTDYAFIQMMILKQPQATMAGGDPLKAAAQGLADICGRHGLKLWKDGKFLPEKEMNAAVGDFLVDLACRTIRRKSDGKLVDRETARKWVEELEKKKDQEPPAAANAPEPPPSPFEAASKKVIEARYGGEEALKKRVAPLAVRLGGWYWPDIFSVRNFEYTLTVPGGVVWTNGEVLAGDRVRWTFDARLAWPLGYDMACRSLEPQTKLQEELLKGKPLATREAMADFVALVGPTSSLDALSPQEPPAEAKAKPDENANPKARLLKVLRDCREGKSMAPLYEYRDEVAKGKGTSDAEARRVQRLFELLKLPDKP